MALANDDVIERTPLDSAGVTGARLTRVTFADGRMLIEKVVDQRTDWLMRATGDDGRIFRLWTTGVLHRLPPEVDSTIATVEPLPEGWLVVMRDVSDALVPDGPLLSRTKSRRVLAAVSALHEAFAGTHVGGLCPLVDRLAFLTPAAVRAIDAHPLRDIVLEGWARFEAVAPAPVGRAVLALLEPGRLAAALATYPETVLHGDLKLANIGFTSESVILLDWGTLTGMGPRALDLAWYVAVNGAAIDASLDEQLADVAAVLAPEHEEALPLALLGQLVLLGWEKALGATSDDPTTRAREHAGLTWWCDRAAQALEQWPLA